MRARLKFTTDLAAETLVGQLREHDWLPHFDEDSQEAKTLINEVRDSVEEGDLTLFDQTKKTVLSDTVTETRGTLSMEHGVWVLRLLNPNIHLLQRACEILTAQLVAYASRNHQKIEFKGPVQIVERKRKETIIEGQTLTTPKDRLAYARSQRHLEVRIALWGATALLALLAVTFPWAFRDSQSHTQTWLFSVFEKFIGSVAVTTLIAYAQYRTFLAALREHTIRWSIPGQPEKLDIRPPAA